jgi:hypothetical protein
MMMANALDPIDPLQTMDDQQAFLKQAATQERQL